MKHLDYLRKDYDAFLEMFYELITEQFPNWSKYNENNFGDVFGRFLAMLGDIESFYHDKMIQQLCLPTVTLRKYAILACKRLGYKMSSAQPPIIEQVQFTITPQTQDFTIPAGYPVSTKAISQSGDFIQYETDKDLVIPAGETTGIVSATQGVTIQNELIGTSNGRANQRFILKHIRAIDGYYEVYVNENSILKRWNETETFAGIGSEERFKVEVDEVDRTFIIFGDGVNGRIPPLGSEIFCKYRVGGGTDKIVGVGAITENRGNIHEILSITNLTPAIGGSDRETIQQAKENAPLFFKTAERAVNADDFKALCLRNKDVKRATALASKRADIIDVYIASKDNNGVPSEELKSTIKEFLNKRKIITFLINVLSPYFPEVLVTVNATAENTVSRSDCEAAIIARLSEIISYNNLDFEWGVKLGDIYSELLALPEVSNIEISRFTTNPIVYARIQSPSPLHTFEKVDILPANNLVGEWKVTMQDSTNFTVEFYDDENNQWIDKGNGQIGSEFTSNGNEIKFTITSNGGTSVSGDYWSFYTHKYLGNIPSVLPYEILKLGTPEIIVEGGSDG